MRQIDDEPKVVRADSAVLRPPGIKTKGNRDLKGSVVWVGTCRHEADDFSVDNLGLAFNAVQRLNQWMLRGDHTPPRLSQTTRWKASAALN